MGAVDVQAVGSADVADEKKASNTPHRSIRLEKELWEPLDAAARANGLDRSGLIRQFVRWYLRVPGAKLPPRPALRLRAVEDLEDE